MLSFSLFEINFFINNKEKGRRRSEKKNLEIFKIRKTKPKSENKSKTMRYYLSLQAWKCVIFILVFITIWCFTAATSATSGGDIDDARANGIHLLLLFIVAHLCAEIGLIVRIPSLLGYLIAGIIYGNVIDVQLNRTLTTAIRSVALMIIFVRAGLNLDPAAIRRLIGVTFRLGLLPTSFEALTVGAIGYFVFGIDVARSAMLGFVVAAVSPAVVVPGMIAIRERGYGLESGIPTLMIAAASIDNVFAITAFNIAAGFAFTDPKNSTEEMITATAKWDILWPIANYMGQILLGIAYGTIAGIILWFIPAHRPDEESIKSKQSYDAHRFVIFNLMAIVALFGSAKLQLKSSGPLAILVLAFVTAIRWRRQNVLQFHENAQKLLWIIFEHFLYALIGADAKIGSMKADIIGLSVAVVIAGMLARILIAFVSVFVCCRSQDHHDPNGPENYSTRERIFIALAWVPKATVQAAIGSVALDEARNDAERRAGHIILTIAVLSILITAPIGALAIEFGSRRWLSKNLGNHQNKICENEENNSDVARCERTPMNPEDRLLRTRYDSKLI